MYSINCSNYADGFSVCYFKLIDLYKYSSFFRTKPETMKFGGKHANQFSILFVTVSIHNFFYGIFAKKRIISNKYTLVNQKRNIPEDISFFFRCIGVFPHSCGRVFGSIFNIFDAVNRWRNLRGSAMVSTESGQHKKEKTGKKKRSSASGTTKSRRAPKASATANQQQQQIVGLFLHQTRCSNDRFTAVPPDSFLVDTPFLGYLSDGGTSAERNWANFCTKKIETALSSAKSCQGQRRNSIDFYGGQDLSWNSLILKWKEKKLFVERSS